MITVRSPAKINLILKVKEKRPDQYHNIETVMQEIDWSDTITLKLAPNGFSYINTGIQIKGQPDENLILRAAKLFFDTTHIQNPSLTIALHKRIPIGSGMGGGSSNAIATLVGLNHLYQKPLETEQLTPLAEKLGSDTSFFLHGGRCFCSGRGELVTPLPNDESTVVNLLIPEVSVSTAEVFRNYTPSKTSEFTFNDLQESAFQVSPLLKEIQQQLEESTGKPWRLTGSGSTFFYVQPMGEEPLDLKQAQTAIKGRFITTHFSYQGCHVSEQ